MIDGNIMYVALVRTHSASKNLPCQVGGAGIGVKAPGRIHLVRSRETKGTRQILQPDSV
jgi:hypothetical protein